MFDDKHLPSKGQVLFARQLQFRLLCRSSSKGYCYAFWLVFHIIHAAVAHLYVIFIEYLMVVMFAEMLFNQF